MVMKAFRWILPALAGVVLGAALLWFVRPVWGICIDVAEGTEGGGCFSGTTDGPAILFTALLVIELVVLAILAFLLEHRRPIVLGAICGIMLVTLLVGLAVTFSGVWTPPYPML